MLIADQLISFTVIHKIVCHISVDVPYSNNAIDHFTVVKLS